MEERENLKELKHHKQQDLCTTRPRYRQGRKLTAVKVRLKEFLQIKTTKV